MQVLAVVLWAFSFVGANLVVFMLPQGWKRRKKKEREIRLEVFLSNAETWISLRSAICNSELLPPVVLVWWFPAAEWQTDALVLRFCRMKLQFTSVEEKTDMWNDVSELETAHCALVRFFLTWMSSIEQMNSYLIDPFFLSLLSYD